MSIFSKNNIKGKIPEANAAVAANTSTSDGNENKEVITYDKSTGIIDCRNDAEGFHSALHSYDSKLFAGRIIGWDRFCLGIIDTKTNTCISAQVIYLNSALRKNLENIADSSEGVAAIVKGRNAMKGKQLQSCRFVREPLVLLDPASKQNYGCNLLAFVN